jgi:predicted nucleic-acid-binding protein
MIGLDTNVIVRYITQDDPAQSAKANKLIESFSADEPGFVSAVSMVELVWVMQACYRASKGALVDMLETLLRTEELRIENADIMWQALRRFQTAQADFADCVIERCGHAAACKHTVTFDHDAAKGAGMKAIG